MPQDNIHFASEQVLDELAARICSGLKAAAEARCHAWHHHLDIGDALIEAQERVSTGWKRWLRTNCALSVRSAFRYAQLARHREKIEAEVQATGGAEVQATGGQLSMRAALRLITEPSTRKKKNKAGAVETAELNLNAHDDAAVTAALAAYGLERFLQVIPHEWRSVIQRRTGGQVVSVIKQRHGDKRVSDLKAHHLALAVDNTSAPATVETGAPTTH
jgi:hypothetical protein